MDTPNESQVNAILQMENGVTGTLHIDADSVTEDQAYFTIYGTGGILFLTDPNQFGGEVRFLPVESESGKKAEPYVLPAVNEYMLRGGTSGAFTDIRSSCTRPEPFI